MQRTKVKPVRQDMIRAYPEDKRYLEAITAIGMKSGRGLNAIIKNIVVEWYEHGGLEKVVSAANRANA